MKKILVVLIFLILHFDGFTQSNFSLPYFDNFESKPNWKADKSQVWVYGLPKGKKINKAYSGKKAWYIASDKQDKSLGYLVSPVFKLNAPKRSRYIKFSMAQSLDFLSKYEGASLQYRLDDGEWTDFGFLYCSNSKNWFNGFIAYKSGWTDVTCKWRHAYQIIKIDQAAQIQFRIEYLYGASKSDGMAIDNVSITEYHGGLNVSDSLALVALYKSTKGENWNRKDNWLKGPLETWYGLHFSQGLLYKIDLSNNNLKGPIPKKFTRVKTRFLTLSGNHVTGSIPTSLGEIKGLGGLDLSYNELTGHIPKELGNFKFFTSGMDLSHNRLTGGIPNEILIYPENFVLTLNDNQLSGSIPDLTHSPIVELNLENNRFTSVPSEKGVYYLFLSGNKLTFESLKPYIQNAYKAGDSLPSDTYSPQDSVGESKSYVVDRGTNLTLTGDYAGNSSNNRYQWFKEGKAITPIKKSPILELKNLPSGFQSYYYCAITNINVPDLVLWSRKVSVKVRTHKEMIDKYMAVGQRTLADGLKVWPNPFTSGSELTIDLIGYEKTNIEIIVKDQQGSEVYSSSRSGNTAGESQKINFDNLQKGVYFITVKSKGKADKVVRVLKE